MDEDTKRVYVNESPSELEHNDVVYDTDGNAHIVDEAIGNHIFFTDGKYAVSPIENNNGGG